jgi:hypothetical protein
MLLEKIEAVWLGIFVGLEGKLLHFSATQRESLHHYLHIFTQGC